MLSQGQFFKGGDYDIDPSKMHFDQFDRAADYYHGSPTIGLQTQDTFGKSWGRTYSSTHVGTRQSAIERIQSRKDSGVIWPLRHVGEDYGGVHSDARGNRHARLQR